MRDTGELSGWIICLNANGQGFLCLSHMSQKGLAPQGLYWTYAPDCQRDQLEFDS